MDRRTDVITEIGDVVGQSCEGGTHPLGHPQTGAAVFGKTKYKDMEVQSPTSPFRTQHSRALAFSRLTQGSEGRNPLRKNRFAQSVVYPVILLGALAVMTPFFPLFFLGFRLTIRLVYPIILRPRLTTITSRLWCTRVLKVLSSPPTLRKRSLAAGLLKTNTAGLVPLRSRQKVSPMCRPLLLERAEEVRFSPTHFKFILRKGRSPPITPPRLRRAKNLTVRPMATLNMLQTPTLRNPILSALVPKCPLR